MIRKLLYILPLPLLLLLVSGCQPTRTLQEEQYLYTGATLQYPDDKASLSGIALESTIGQQPNQYFLGMPVRLGIYNAMAKKKGKLGK